MKRRHGLGQIEEKGGKYYIRMTTPDGRRRRFGSADTPEEAEAAIEGLAVELAEQDPGDVVGVTLAAYGDVVLKKRERDGIENWKSEQGHWRNHVVGTTLGKTPISVITPRMVRTFASSLARKKAMPGRCHKTPPSRTISVSTQKQVLSSIRIVLEDAADAGLIDSNPALEVRARKPKTVELPVKYLTLDEQVKLLASTPEPQRWIVAFAMYTGMRIGELWSLRWPDVHDDHVVVRFGGHDHATKSGAPRIVPLITEASMALDIWRGRGFRGKGNDLVFPTRCGKPRPTRPLGVPKAPYGWSSWVRQAGLPHHNFHHLRDTCATSLLSGLWGWTWHITQVAALLGHSTNYVTERYAKIVEGVAARAAAEHNANRPPIDHLVPGNPAPPGRFELPTNGLGNRRQLTENMSKSVDNRPPVADQDELLLRAWCPWGARSPQVTGDPEDLSVQIGRVEA